MLNIIKKFEISSKLSEEFKEKIKIFHVFNESSGYNILFITSDDIVFGLGSNSHGCCGLGHNRVIYEPQIILELCHQNIKQFFNGLSFVLAINESNQVYGWGGNGQSELGRGHSTLLPNRFLKPKVIKDLKNKCITEVSCGAYHSLALSSDGIVYGWGCNYYGQIGRGKQNVLRRLFDLSKVKKPTKLKLLENHQVISIYCFSMKSYALTNDGFAFSWGLNEYCSLGHELAKNKHVYKPRLISLCNIISISCSTSNTYFLTNKGFIYFCGYFEDQNSKQLFYRTPKLLYTNLRFKSLHSIANNKEGVIISTALATKGVYYLNWDKIQKTNYKNIFDFYCHEYGMTSKTMCVG